MYEITSETGALEGSEEINSWCLAPVPRNYSYSPNR